MGILSNPISYTGFGVQIHFWVHAHQRKNDWWWFLNFNRKWLESGKRHQIFMGFWKIIIKHDTFEIISSRFMAFFKFLFKTSKHHKFKQKFKSGMLLTQWSGQCQRSKGEPSKESVYFYLMRSYHDLPTQSPPFLIGHKKGNRKREAKLIKLVETPPPSILPWFLAPSLIPGPISPPCRLLLSGAVFLFAWVRCWITMPPSFTTARAVGSFVRRSNCVRSAKNGGQSRMLFNQTRCLSGIAPVHESLLANKDFNTLMGRMCCSSAVQRRSFLGCVDGEEGGILSKVYEERRIIG